MAFGISVQTSVEAAKFLEGLGKLLNCWWITGNQERPYCGFRGTEVQIHDPTGHYLFARNFGEDFRDLLRKPNKAAAGFRQNRFSARFRVPSFRGYRQATPTLVPICRPNRPNSGVALAQ